MLSAVKNCIKGVIPSFKVREKLAAKYLKGSGVEIGALHLPLRVPRGVTVKYVDYCTRDENIHKFPELTASNVVETDFVEDGFQLQTFDEGSVDFVIANHVLEHADDPVGVLLNWLRVIRPGGIVMATVPIMARCFDRGREETSVEHLLEDHRLVASGRIDEFRIRNRRHFHEVITISLRNQIGADSFKTMSAEELEATVSAMASAERPDTHYHTFSADSYTHFLQAFTAEFAPDVNVLAVNSSRGGTEVVAFLEKTAG
ncbi:class I SAM-dependent methyltransferase [Geomonas sp. Red32]|uniref:methyltransferase domain-containing protein n=1 Tax=Geomonas sp. Red32 TaxID=2912856 RepID=UPI00202CC101|nr:class I SAM-dependent methyltransferase [Geomonas sp. Red32]MCM0084052.1 class I SAM-dependent methyltransferase [Geomonas sp. Red32]